MKTALAKVATPICFAISISGCASLNSTQQDDAATKSPKAAVMVDTALTKYAKSATDAMTMLASVQMASENVKTREVLLSEAPQGLDLVYKRSEWLDDIEAIVSTIAADTGWSYLQPIGSKTATVVVGVNAINKSAYEVLREVGIKSGRAATVMVNVSTRELMVRYPDLSRETLVGGGR